MLGLCGPRLPGLHPSASCSLYQQPSDLILAGRWPWKAGQAYQRNPIDWSLVDSMHDHRMAECMQSYVCLVLISVRDKVMVAGVFHIRDKSHNL
eukprot:COSAG05_NODE_1051_length_6031_cov_8.987190_1_plen_94_part_00